jgi:glycosyltransferase involved in cell wall biosynthesis
MAPKTLHITNSYHPASGGVRTFYHALMEEANRQHRFVRLVVPGAETTVEEVGEFARIYSIKSPRVPVLDRQYRWMLPHTYASRGETPLRQILAAEKPDLVEVCDKFWLLYLSGVLRRRWIPDVPVPVIVGLSCERLDENMAAYISRGRLARRICQEYVRRCYVPRFDFHLAASSYIADEIRRLLPPDSQERLHVCPMGVDFRRFNAKSNRSLERAELLRQIAGTSKSVVILYAGRISKEKNLTVLPEVLRSLLKPGSPDYRLVIAGNGPLADELRKSLERAAPGRSIIVGQCQRDRLAVLYRAADIFIHPNPREPFGIAPLEAMAAGLPVVAPGSGGILTYANSTNAWLTEPTSAGLAEAIRSVQSNPGKRLQKVECALHTAKEYAWPRVTRNFFQLYDDFCDAVRHPDLATGSKTRTLRTKSAAA